jgi:hypothetical protein
MDTIKNYYNDVKKPKKTKEDKNFKNHYIQPNSMILFLGGTGSGKTNALLNMLERMDEKFYRILLFSFITTDEPLLDLLCEKMPEIELYNDPEEIPDLNEFEDDKENEKLIIFDDFINLENKELKKIENYLTGARKLGVSCVLMGQEYNAIPKRITRNTHYFLIFPLNDNATINTILKNHNRDGIDKEELKQLYNDATKNKFDFFMIDNRGTPQTRYRHNFLDFYNLNGGSVESGFVKKLFYKPEFDINKIKEPSANLKKIKS